MVNISYNTDTMTNIDGDVLDNAGKIEALQLAVQVSFFWILD